MTEDLHVLVAGHLAVFDGLLAVSASLADDAWSTPTGCPGWDVHDQLAHCIGLERLMLGHPVAEVEVPDHPYLRSDLGRLVERDVEARRSVAHAYLREEAEVTFVRRRARLEALDGAALDGEIDTPLGRMPARRGLRLRLFDLTSHEEDVRRALGLPPAAGPHVTVAVTTALRSVARSLPSRLPDTPGLVAVQIDRADPVGLDVASGRFLPELDRAPAATLSVTSRQVLALAGGRSDAPDVAELELGGDHDLARRVVSIAGITP